MPGTKKTMSEVVRNLWAAVADKRAPDRAVPEVIIHDPEAKLPHDLDDPFFDRGVQSRTGDVISNANKK